MAPWRGPRHRSWASNGNLAAIGALIVFATYVAFEVFGEAPVALVNLLGPTVGVWFASVASDKSKRDKETEATAQAAEVKADTANAKADRLAEAVEHPELAEPEPPTRGRPPGRARPPARGDAAPAGGDTDQAGGLDD
ncbi:hypothetical protein [Mycobacterium phage Weirdo19]|uniref:Uncharacterized protein n=1 Tax=Mycobacterium phage Weirdo19 TaxID=2601610 RepID=A0A6M2YSU3_9CAUD|nr:hypothetical protein KDJ11_gp29 [Mycobacterium phage Weirdo19]QEA10797.1 hypothetical protein [Mycobacterium phage Weirdo19]